MNLGHSLSLDTGSSCSRASESESVSWGRFSRQGFLYGVFEFVAIFMNNGSASPVPTRLGAQLGDVQSCGSQQMHTRDTGMLYSEEEVLFLPGHCPNHPWPTDNQPPTHHTMGVEGLSVDPPTWIG